MKLAKTYSYLKKDLDIIEEALADVIQAEHPVLREASTQLLKAGGKRIRPVFVLLSGQFGQKFDIEKIKTVAISLELIHMATLVHDDVIDDAELRRGKPTVKKNYGNQVAMYTGDYILARALENITSIKDSAIHRTLSKALVEVSLGEIEQMKDKFNWNQNFRTYLRRIKRKTALLIAISCKLGAITSGLSDKEINYLYQYGYNIGMSYQIIDDILDFTSSPEKLGKPAGNDLIQGNITLPVLIARQDASFNQLLLKTFDGKSSVSNDDMVVIINALKQTDAIDRSYEISDIYLNKAIHNVNKLPEGKSKQTLINIAKIIGKRTS
ncbi:heptaprenyl diphosphate synthase component II [Ornithinibacillus sp. L9]|uniref:Heptaprenyl diphosphate synthase component 2 n=1 Tax=Ornithinibacillus caprae TaxID=2678566 RepID=A0A6N8FHP3_9BACI|nr:heptaprenyl diphosphate synthase component II [Ornithinibacillus caprae]MUK87269.1 heptaprenyl diphosphate synthase component II [Ornithinibacillus caprae]